MELDLTPGESRGYWKYHTPGKWFKQAKAVGKINNEKATFLFDSGAEVSIIDTTFARKVGCVIDENQTQECIGIGESTYMTMGRTKIKITLNGSLVYYFDVWVGDQVGQEAILGMDFMVPAGIRLDLADGTLCLPDEVRICLAGRRPPYRSNISAVNLNDQHVAIAAGRSAEVRIGVNPPKSKLWVRRDVAWIPTVTNGPGRIKFLQLTNVSDRDLILNSGAPLALWMTEGMIPRSKGYVSVGSRRYMEWQTLAFEATTDREEEEAEAYMGPLVDHPTYEKPTRILSRSKWRSDDIKDSVEITSPSDANGDSNEELHDEYTSGRNDEDKDDGSMMRSCAVNVLRKTPEPSGEEDVVAKETMIAKDHQETTDPLQGQSNCHPDGIEAEDREVHSQATRLGDDVEVVTIEDEVMERDVPDESTYYHEGGELFAEDVEQHMAVLPEITVSTTEITIDDVQVGDPGMPLTEDQEDLRQLIWKSRHLLIGKGNALPPAARGAVCDIDVGEAKPIAQRVRPVAPKFREKLADLIKGLLSAKIIRPSTSPWASPIVVIIKKNGEDIRLCIDYRRVNQLTQLMVYPMPLISELLQDMDKAMWYCSLDMASGFWVVEMTERARSISAFITPSGLFEWLRMPFGLKNAPQIYQRLIDNALYGYLKIGADKDVNVTDQPKLTDVFTEGEPETDQAPSVLGRRSYIDDILIPATSWTSLYDKVERLLTACDRWNLSISLTKSFWGRRKVDYLGHQVSLAGLEANPKDLGSLVNIPFPTTLRSMQSFLGSLNYYSRFIEDFAVYASVLYELREADFFEMSRMGDRGETSGSCDNALQRDEHDQNERSRWERAAISFASLKAKIATTPILKHFDSDRLPVIVVYASKWAVSASLVQEYDGVYWPVTFTSRTLKPNEVNYGMVEKEVLALLRILEVCYTMLVSREIRVLTRYSTLAWLVQSSGLNGRLGRWAALLSNWTLEVQRCTKGEDEILGALAASITPRDEVDDVLIAIAPQKKPKQLVTMLPPTVGTDECLLVVSFDGSARTKRKSGAYSAIVWKLPEWTIISAASEYAADLTVNAAEYRGLLLGLDLLDNQTRGRVIICGDSNLVIRQMRGEMDCKAPGLQLLRHKAMQKLRSWPKHEFLHMKREWNQSADRLASAALQQEKGVIVNLDQELQELISLNRLHELLLPERTDCVVKMMAITRSARRRRQQPEVLQEEIVQQMRIERIKQAQEEESWIANLKEYIVGDLTHINAEDAKLCARIAPDYEVDENGLLFFSPRSAKESDDRMEMVRLVVPELLQEDFMHHYHTSLEGGHQGIGRTYQRIRSNFHWRGLYRSVQRYVGKCVDCTTGKGLPAIRGRSPGNIQATYPFQVIAMDHIPSLPRSFKGNTELLLWVDLFSGYVIARASSSRTAQAIAEGYEECVFRRFGASEAIRHDREPGFMSDFFRAFNRIAGQKQRATMAYRPQANGTAERMVQTLTRSIKMYVTDVEQKDWDEYAERLTFAMNTAHDRIRGDTPFYLIHGWDPRSTLEATLPLGSTKTRDADPRRWRYNIQRQYQKAREVVNERLRIAIQDRADRHNGNDEVCDIKCGSQVWLYLDRVKDGYARKLAHMWHGPFRVAELCGEHAVRVEISGTPYRLFPTVHVSKLKPMLQFPDRPSSVLVTDCGDRVDFDESLLPEDSWEGELAADEYEVEKILDVRSGRKTRYGRVHRQFLVQWKKHDDPTWIDEADLNCGALLQDFERNRVSQNRFEVMQSHEEETEG